MKKIFFTFLITLFVLAVAYPHNKPNPKLKKGRDNGSSIKLPNGFSVKIIATDLGATRHIAVAKNGDIYANGNAQISGTVHIVGAVTIDDLAGAGSRAVLADASGVLSAPVSDRSVKDSIKTLDYGLSTLMKLKPVSFYYKPAWQNYGTRRQVGFIAQDVEKVLPASVFETPKTGKKGYNEIDIIPVLTKAVQELSAKVDAQQKQINTLNKKLKKKRK